jgi:hypothetical protein
MALQLGGIVTGAPADLQANPDLPSLIQGWVKQRDALIRDNWERLEELANQGLGDAYAAYRTLMRSLGAVDALSQETNATLATFLTFHASQEETRREFFEELKRQLVQRRPNLPANDRAALDELGEGKIRGNLMLRRLKATESQESDTDTRAIEYTVALFNRSLVALFYASYNTRYKELRPQSFENFGDRLLSDIQAQVDGFEQGIDARARSLYKALNDGKGFQSAGEQLAAHIEEGVAEFGRVQAALNLYVEGQRKASAPERLVDTLGRLAVKASELSRSAFALHAAAYYLCLQSKAVEQDPKAKKMLQGPDTQPYASAFPNGKDTRLKDIGSVGEGSFIELRGFVSSLTAKRGADRKLLSVFTLTDRSGSVEVDAVGVFAQLRNVGLLEGAFCQCSGSWRKQSAINGGKPALEIQQLRIDELSERSWNVQLHDLSDRFIDWWPAGLNIAYGVSPHVSGGPDGGSKKLGAGELIFRQFYRD